MRAYPLLCLALIATVLIASCTPKETVTTPPVTDQPVVATQPDADTTEAAPPSEPAADASELAGSDWPRFFGPNADGTSPDTGINKDWSAKPPQELWRVSLGDDGYAGPAVADGKVFIVDHQGKDDVVRAIDIATGKDAWTFPYPEPGGHNYGFTRGTPCYDNGTLYTLSMSGQLHAINAADGTKVWSKNLPQDFGGKAPNWRYASSPVVDGDRLVVLPGGQSSVAVLDKTTGDTIWAGGGPSGASYATPTIATINGVKQYIVFTAEALTGVKADDGTVLWDVQWPTKHRVNAAMPVADGDHVFATSNYQYGGGLYEISGSSAKQVWFSKEMQSHFSSPVYYEGFLYGTTDPGDLICMTPADGKVMWRQSGFEKGGTLIVDGVVIAMNGKGGDVVMAEASTAGYKELGRIKPLDGQSWTAPIVAMGRLLVRNKGAMVCLDLR